VYIALTQPLLQGGMGSMGATMRFAIICILAVLACAGPANAVVYEINAVYEARSF
jgi:hypothetical protein